MDRVSMVSQPFQNFPETRFGRAAPWRCPSCGTKSIPYGKFPLAPLVQKVQGFLQDFCNIPAVFTARAAECASFSMWTFGRAGGRAKPGVRQFLEQIGRFGKAAPAYPPSHYFKNAHPLVQRDRQNIAGTTPLAGVSIRRALTRTCPPLTSRAARLRVLATRAKHSHLSSRWRSDTP